MTGVSAQEASPMTVIVAWLARISPNLEDGHRHSPGGLGGHAGAGENSQALADVPPVREQSHDHT